MVVSLWSLVPDVVVDDLGRDLHVGSRLGRGNLMSNELPGLRLAWFSPLPPSRSGIAVYSAELLPLLEGEFTIDRFPECDAHDFVWRHRRAPYDVIVYQLGNAPFHDYMWPYLASYPGLVVLHDARLHHARARQLLSQKRFDDYRHEFWFDHPDATRDFVEYAVEGLGGPIYYFWSMLRVVMQTARAVAVHNARVAETLRAEYEGVAIDTIRMGVPAIPADAAARTAARRALALTDGAVVFAVFGKITAAKRISSILHAFATLHASVPEAVLLLLGDAGEYVTLDREIAHYGIAARVRVTGHIADDAVGTHLAAADVCLCLRWPTAQETSASWLRCLAAGRPTVVTDLAHLADLPTIEPCNWRCTPPSSAPVAVRIDLLDEASQLERAMRRLAEDSRLRSDLSAAGEAWRSANHTTEIMAGDYRRILKDAAARGRPAPADLPAHLTRDHTGGVREIADRFGVSRVLSFLHAPR
jgi:glycosyltransferase involved in cell wall biosynthesis